MAQWIFGNMIRTFPGDLKKFRQANITALGYQILKEVKVIALYK
ncbi:MAG: hypothetical protein ACK4IY_02780 [Chitinophagales bacterium]